MDLERVGAPEAAGFFLDAYVEFSGDSAPPSLRHHYMRGVRSPRTCP
ncbi:hypothetical protein [Pseudonocardia sp. T1-2H]